MRYLPHRVALFVVLFATLMLAAVGAGIVHAAAPVLGDNTIEATTDPSSVGTVEATQYTASASATIDLLSIYLDRSNAATGVALGIYDDANGSPGTLLASGSLAGIQNGAWNNAAVAPTALVAGRSYWIARLAVSGGDVVTRGNNSVANADRVDTRRSSALPSVFSPGGSWPHLASMFASSSSSSTSSASGFVGNSVIESSLDASAVGEPEATQFTATATGVVSTLSIYLDASSAAQTFELGIYGDASGVPGALLAKGSGTATNGAWDSVSISAVTISAGTPYWLARLAVSGGPIVTRGAMSATNPDRTDTRSSSTLPATYSPGASYPHRASIYAGTVPGPTATPNATATATATATSAATATVTPSATATATPTSTAVGGFVGNGAVETTRDPSAVGQAEATRYTATTSGPVSTISIYLDSSNAATNIALGIYSDAAGMPGTLLAQGSRSGVTSGAWNSVAIPTLSITAGTPYWIARLAVSGGTLVTRGNDAAGNADRVDTRFLSVLPTTFSPGASYPHRVSMYAGTAAGTPPPTPSPTPLPTPTATPGTGGACMEVIGFSQTQQWYFGGPPGFDQFLSQMPPRGTQLRWQGGAAIDSWADPSFWPDLVNSCASGSSSPDRVVLNISGGYSSDVSWWHDQIRLAVTNVRNHYPAVRTIYLQPVVGGPNHAICPPLPGVRASYNEPYIGQAIDRLQSEGVGVWGANPLVRTCADYADYDPGHLTDDAKAYIATIVGGFYRNR
jgi:hypothetical protein